MTRAVRVLFVFALVFLLPGTAAWAQQNTADLNGTVSDDTNLVLPGVTVTVTGDNTGLTRTVVTDGAGFYFLAALPPGPYQLEVALQGFRSYLQTGLVLEVGATPTVDVTLELGAVEETVTVTADVPLVDVRSAGIGSVIANDEILELPLQGRQVTDLLVLAGAAVQTGSAGGRHIQGGVYISVGGGLPGGVGYTLDGAAHNARQNNANLPLPFPDALQEFRVSTSATSAENGVKSGASVSAVTKSGTNRFSGNVFEFFRDASLNSPGHFAAFDDSGKQEDDGLKRHQYGFTLGGPIVQDRLFFFAGYQGTPVRVRPTARIAVVPTPAMIAGDLSTYASKACQGKKGVKLGAPYVNNKIDPALFSPTAMNLIAALPAADDECGNINYSMQRNSDHYQPITRVDFQASNNHSVFGRYMYTKMTFPSSYEGAGDNVLKTAGGAQRGNFTHSLSVGETSVFGAGTVNSVRVGYNRSLVDVTQLPYFDPTSLGSNITTQLPGQMPFNARGEFTVGTGSSTIGNHKNQTYQVSDDLSFLRGDHQISLGVNLDWWTETSNSSSRSNGNWIFDGRHTGTSIADLMVGRVYSVEQGGFGHLPVDNLYAGVYAQDAWRVSDRVTLNVGLRWEPYFGQNVRNGVVAIFDQARFSAGTKSVVYTKAPAGFIWDGDEGFPDNGKTGQYKQWLNFSPRMGLAWDVHGDGRTAVRSSYAMLYDFPAGELHNIHANAPPFGNRLKLYDPPGLMDDPYLGVPGGNPFPVVRGPDTPFVPYGSFGTMDPDINSPRVQTWNLTIEQQVGADWGLSAAYLGSYSDRIWMQEQLNPGIYFPGKKNSGKNLHQRRVLWQENPDEAQYIGSIDKVTDWGYQNYHGLKLSVRRRAVAGVSVNGNYTLSRCWGTDTPMGFDQASSGYHKSGFGERIQSNIEYDAGYCDQDRRHLATLTVGYLTPQFDSPALRAIASNWRFSTIVSARTGSRLTIESGKDTAVNGQRYQRPNQLSDDVYGKPDQSEPGERIDGYFNFDAFERPKTGQHGTALRNSVVGPNFWNIDLAISRLIEVGAARRLEFRLESFNVLNHVNWGNPARRQDRSSFGRITSQAGTPRIVQLGVKFAF